MRKIIIQFNEANFDLIEKYSVKYNLKGFKKILKFKTIIKTSSEVDYNKLEPWIQWYSFYTSKSYEEHKIFHLGDSKNSKDKNFVDYISEKKKVGCFGSMNLPFNEKFLIYISDPWSRNKNDNSISSKLVYKAVEQVVNSNNSFKISFSSLFGILLLIGFPKNFKEILKIFNTFFAFIKKDRASLVGLFDFYFFNYSLRRILKNDLDFSLIFLNGLAHIQHRFMMESEFINKPNIEKNIKGINEDKILTVLRIYDECFKKFLDIYENKIEVWFITALTQKVYNKKKIYWRFKDHKKILNNFFDFTFSVDALMTRDFKISCENQNNFNKICDFLKNAKVFSSHNQFLSYAFSHIDKINNTTVFSTLAIDEEDNDLMIAWNDIRINIKDQLEFVALKNGEHSQEGWAFSNRYCNKKNTAIWELNKFLK